MDDAVQAGFGGDFELLKKNLRLLLFVAFVLRRGTAGLMAGKPVIVQAGFAERHDLGVFRQVSQRRPQILRRFEGVRRMPARNGEHFLESFGERDRAPAALQVRADAEDALDARGARPVQKLGEVRRKLRVIEMGVGVEERRHEFSGA